MTRGVRILWGWQAGSKVLALTFDDGPHPELTPRVLDALAEHEVPATFFMLGSAAELHPRWVTAVHRAGHEIGNHTWTHPRLWLVDRRQVRREIRRTDALLGEIVGAAPRWFRPPRGQLTAAATEEAAAAGHDICLWTAMPTGSEATPAQYGARLSASARPGAILACHDGIGRGTLRPGTDLADELLAVRITETGGLAAALGRLVEQKWRFVRVSEIPPDPIPPTSARTPAGRSGVPSGG